MFTATTRVSALLAALALTAPAAAQARTPAYERVLGERADAGAALYAQVETARARAELESALTKRGQRLNELVATNRSTGMWARLTAAFSLGSRAKVLDSAGEAGASVYPTVAFRDDDTHVEELRKIARLNPQGDRLFADEKHLISDRSAGGRGRHSLVASDFSLRQRSVR